MSKWKHINLVYLYDETFEGFLSIVFDCYKNKIIPSDIKSKNKYNINLMDIFTVKQFQEVNQF